ncbi:uncharacterized protein K441DRAFT_545195, partial [Cenococcum geophilum 1.58]|uniref:uncharacterized protein n=1 Tax=Cenococcum geophilum 1.58 TaxID=794803 RepID=UPI00358E6859
IIFVHGLGGGSIKTWNRSGICWPRDLLPDWMENCARIMTWGYDSTSYANQNGLLLLAETLLKDIEMKRRNVIERQRPVVFVCHSLGGLVVKQALLQAQKFNEQGGNFGGIYACTSGIIFFGTPHRDSSSASLSQLVANVANTVFKQTHNNLWHIISGNQNALVTQSKSFRSISADMLLVSIFEEQPINHSGIVS